MNAWQGSDAQAWCRDFAGSEGDSIADAFSTAELSAILETTKSDREFTSSTYSVPFAASENILNEDKVFFLSAEEAENSNYGFTDDNARIANYGNSASLWWLRSPSSDLANFAGCVDFGGSVSFNFTYSYWAARPAFNLNPDSVLFTSAAEGVKSQSGMDSGLTAVSDYTGNEWKLTLLDSSRSEFSIGTMAIEGDTLTVAYSGATTGDNEYISAVVTDENDEITYYGRLQSVAGADGTVQVTLPDGFDSTTDTLYIFNEQYNGDKATDYAGEPKEVSMTLVGGGLSGTGTAEDPYLIADADDLKAFRDLVNAGYRKICGKLMADIVLNEDLDQSKFNAEIVEAGSGRYEIEVTYNGSTEIPDFEQWTPIGNDQSYTGTFDGDGHTVSGIYINTSVGNQGLFGYCYGSTIKGLGVINSYIRGDNAVGGIVGCSYGTVENCYNTGMVVGDLQAGGIVGINAFDSIVRNCYNTGTVTGIEYVGGLAGDIKTSYVGDDGLVTNSFNAGTVSGNNHVGGVAGGTEIVGNVANCYYLNTSAPAGVGGGGGTATSLTAEQITGPSAVETMNLDGSVWVPGGNTDGWHYKGVSDDDETTGEYAYSLYLPQLSAFAENGHESIDIVRTGLPQVTEEDEDGGTITYYLIYNADQLALFADIVNGNLSDADKSIYTEGAAANAILAADIDMSGVSWAGISTSSLAYTGIFDGRGHTLSNLTGTEALFAYNAGTIKNVRLTNVSISRGGNNLGAVAGLNTGTIFNCVTSGTVTLTSGNSVGGIAGYNNSGTVAGCYSDCSVSGGNPGGLIGSNYGGGIVTSSVYLGAEERPIEGDNTHGNKTDVFYKDANDAWHKVNGAGGNTVTADSTAEEAVTSFNAYVRANNGYFLLSAEGEIYPVDLTGSGTADNPYLIYDADQLKTFRNIVNNTLTEEEAERYTANAGACGKLMADIVLNAELDQSKFALGDDGNVTYDGSTEIPDFEQWVPIGNDDTPYAGTFDGNSKTVSGIYINTSSNYQGLFGFIFGGTVKNVGVINNYIRGGDDVGGVAGSVYDASVTNSYNTGAVSGTGNFVGGVVGFLTSGVMENCCNTGTVSGAEDVGGVAGCIYRSGSVTNCYNTGTVSGTDNFVGGVAGEVFDTSVTNSYNTGTVSGDGNVGGVAGLVNDSASVTNSYNTGTVSGDANVGGVSGYVYNNGSVTNSYNTGTVSSDGNVGGIAGYVMKDNMGMGELPGTVTNCYYLNTSAEKGIGSGSGEATPLSAQEMTGQSALTNMSLDSSVWSAGSDSNGWQYAGASAEEDTKTLGIYTKMMYLPQLKVFEKNGNETLSEQTTGLQQVTETGENDSTVKYYLIYNADQLALFRDIVNGSLTSDTDKEIYTEGAAANARLMADIVLNADLDQSKFGLDDDGNVTYDGSTQIPAFEQWTPIGDYFNWADENDRSYRGTFDGNGKTVSGIYINTTSGYQGLFGYVYGSSGTVKDLGVVNNYIHSSGSAGGVVGEVVNASVTNCYNTGTVIGSGNVGGVVGYVNGGIVENSYNTGSVSGSGQNARFGGVAGYVNIGTIENCYNTGMVSATGEYSRLGGVLGQNTFGRIENCYYLEGTAETGLNGDAGETTALTAEQMTGSAALTNMKLDSSVWTAGQDTVWQYQGVSQEDETLGVYTGTGYLPQLSVFKDNGNETLSLTKTDLIQQTDDEDGKTYYLIYNADQLAMFRDKVNGGETSANGRLINDIDLNPGYTFHEDGTYTYSGEGEAPELVSWTPIGNRSRYYSGTFDGNGKTVSGMYISVSSTYQGLFGCISYGMVKDLGIVNSYISSALSFIGGVVGYLGSGIVTNCYNTGTVRGFSSVGGVVAYLYGGTVTNCYNTGRVYGGESGGVIGEIYLYGSVENCYNTGTVSGQGAGGVIGHHSAGTVTNCYYLNTSASTGIGYGIGSGSGEATSVTIAEIEDTSDKGLLAKLVNGSGSGVWNETLSAVTNWDYGKPAVQPVLIWQQVIENAPVYTVTIPEKATAGGDAVNVTMYAGALRADQQVAVRVAEDNDFSLYYSGNTSSDSIKYNAYVNGGGTALTAGALVLSGGNMKSSESPASASLIFTAAGTPKFSGDYTGNITFTVSVEGVQGS